MISSVGMQTRTVPAHKQTSGDTPEMEPERGKSAQSIGHQAKQSVADSGDVAPNAIGKAAAMLAKLDAENLSITAPPVDLT